MGLLQVLLGSFLLSVVHACIPNHWIPLVVIGRAERWGRSEALLFTTVVGLAHASSTILIGILVGLLGYELSARHSAITSIAAPSLLIALGVVYLVWDLAARRRHRHHFEQAGRGNKTSKLSLVASLSAAMFFSPCIELEAYYFSAGSLGWPGILLVSSIYLLVTVLGMLVLVDLGLKGAQRIRSQFLEHHEKRVTGFLLLALGAAAFFVEL
jgi:hypothetical protein